MPTLPRYLTIPIELSFTGGLPVEVPVFTDIDLTLALKRLKHSELIDLHSIKLFELKEDSREEIAVQFSPASNYDLNRNISGMLSWIAQKRRSDALSRNYLLQIDVENANEVSAVSCPPYSRRIFYNDGRAKPISQFPRVQVVPQPYRVAFQRDELEVLAYNCDPRATRPYFFPLIGPAGRGLTRISHPHDPIGHRHHYSIWLGHHDINGVGYWNDEKSTGRQVHKNFTKCEDGPVFARMLAKVDWIEPTDAIVLEETKETRLYPIDNNQLLIDFELSFKAVIDIKFGKTPFAFLGVRVAKSLGVYDGNGMILNSEGMVNEEQIFWKRAKWCDFSGAIAPGRWDGIAIFDHPNNFSHPAPWHVRNDGWFSPALFLESELTLPKSEVLKLNYRLFVHAHEAQLADVSSQYEAFVNPPQVEVKIADSQ